jgi:hypothetical protein
MKTKHIPVARESDPALLIGLWDLRTEPLILGGMLDLVTELHCRSVADGVVLSGLCLIWDKDHLPPGGLPTPTTRSLTPISDQALGHSPIMITAKNIDGIGDCYSAGSIAAIRDFLEREQGRYITWPKLSEDETPLGHEYHFTHNIHDFFRDHDYLPQWSFKADSMEGANDFLRDHVASSLAVIVHAKNDPLRRGTENSRIEVWAEFMRRNQSDDHIKFVVIGNDNVDALRDIPGVVITQDFGNDLTRDIALIKIGDAFMGTASGPAQMAILGDRPYAIYKPIHIYPESMAREFGDGPGYPFAGPGQHFFRIDPTPDDLSEALCLLRTASVNDGQRVK